MSEICPKTLALMSELSEKKPNHTIIKKLCSELNLVYKNDLSELMTFLLQRAIAYKRTNLKQKTTTKNPRSKYAEMSS